jgi:arginyl-tRNA synthetase
MKNFYDKVTQILEKILDQHFGGCVVAPLWEVPGRQDFGDFSTMVALKLAARFAKEPLEIAPEIKKYLAEELGAEVERIEIVKPGFINIFLSSKIIVSSLNEILKNKYEFFKPGFKKKTLIEFLSANPTGPLSIAHGRQAVVGDTIANILEFCGNSVHREYYLNDAGKQIDLFYESTECALSAVKNNIEFMPPEGGYKGEYVKEIAEDFLKQDKPGKVGDFGIISMIKLIKQDMKDLGVKKFDKWFSQKKLISDGKVNEVIEKLKKKELVYDKEGAIWFAATKFGDDKDRVIKKADGELTYFASDIAYHKDKADRLYDELINLWGPDHHGYIKRVKTAMSALGAKDELLKILIIQLVTLKTKERMSKRAGTFIRLSDLIKDVGKDAARFYYLTRKNSSHLEFDIDLAKQASFDNPLYYIQYVCARIESIFRKVSQTEFNSQYSECLKSQEEISLLRTLLQFSYCLEKSYHCLEPVFIIEYLKNLASGFHKFYEQVRVIDDDESLTQARLNLLKGVHTVFHCGLNLLGITPVEKM